MITKLFLFSFLIKYISSKNISTTFLKYRNKEKDLSILCNCSTNLVKSRVVNGTKIPINEYNWIVAIYDLESLNPFCTGSLINENTVLTAAHCFDFDINIEQIFILAGYSNDTIEMLKHDYAHRKVKKVYIHPNYRYLAVKPPNKYDIAIVILHKDFVLGPKFNIFPACILDNEVEDVKDFTYYFAGYGITQSYQLDTKTGKQNLDSTTKNISYIESFYDEKTCINEWAVSLFCLKNNQNSICNGDSGGPIHIFIQEKIYQVGVLVHVYTQTTSDGINLRCYPGYPSIAVKITNVLCWLKTLGKPICMKNY